jgi:hypothetical protein
MVEGRRKPHHTHEINDAYAEGWDARTAWHSSQPKPMNPFVAPTQLVRKQSEGRQSTQRLDVEQWQGGWDDCEIDIKRGDLDEVNPKDFQGAPIYHLDPDCDD